MAKIIVSIVVWLFVGISAVILFIPDFLIWLFSFWWDKRLWLLHRYSSYWSMFYIYINPFWKLDVKGLENIKKDKVYVIISNHQSAFDIVLLYRLMTHFKWVSKKELFNVPVIGWNLWLNRCVRLDRNSTKSALQMMKDSTKHLAEGSSILIFPEGTRSTDGQIKRFKDGAFILAKKTGTPLLPVVIDGTLEILPKSGIVKLKQRLTIHVYPEIPIEKINSIESNVLAKEVQRFMTEKHKEIAPNYYSKENPIE